MSTSRRASKRKSSSSSSKSSKSYSQVAKKIVTESIHLQPGETVTIETWSNGIDLAREVVKEARVAGGIPIVILEDEEAYIYGLDHTPKEVLGKMGKHEYALLAGSDAYVFIPGPPIGMYAPGIPREQGQAATSYNSSWYEAAEKARIRGARVFPGYVGKDLAKLLGSQPEKIIEHQLRAALVDASTLTERAKPILDLLTDGAEARIETGGSTLSIKLNGEVGVEDGVTDEKDVASGNNISYLPGGLIWKDVDPSSANGAVRISESPTRLGLLKDATLEFESGKLVRWSSPDKQSKSKLDSILGAVAEDKRAVMQLTVGINPLMKYHNAMDRFVTGSVSIGGFGFTAIIRNATLDINGKRVTEKGKLVSQTSGS